MATPTQGPGHKEVPVTIRITPGGKIISVIPETFVISISAKEQVKWTCEPDQDFTIEFEPDCPFNQRQFSRGRPFSDLPRGDVKPDKDRKYKYTVKTTSDSLDPDGKIEQ